ncbi:hypothetical protein B0A48_13358 [Cryoendolithus antarcticus]|uniref:CN hydrolase domain-containing protein n=1 Tax=Cryoendolithus antarcticus TaxID=1507870 RepID=A0A1V8SPM0_9PEZI|nr:hypothetical protein B0A48_13358 [Cryoendolithus antarcticus]
MKIAVLQLDSKLRQPERNIATANALLATNPPPLDLDLLVLPELAFTGYNFPSAEAIAPYLEPTAAGRTTQWAITTAKRLRCHVVVGYPEISGVSTALNGSLTEQPLTTERHYNSTVTVSPTGEIVSHYRKAFLYYTDESWASEGPVGFSTTQIDGLGKTSFGICMDINPYQFTAPWDAYEFADQAVKSESELVVLSMAWLTHVPIEEMLAKPMDQELGTIAYWVERFAPVIEATRMGKDVVVVFANRIGVEKNEVESITTKLGQVIPLGDSVCYAGSSCVMRFSGGEVGIYDMLGGAEEGLLVVDTDEVIRHWGVTGGRDR